MFIKKLKNLFGIKPNDWELVETVSSEYDVWDYLKEFDVRLNKRKRVAFFKVYFSRYRQKYKIRNEGYQPPVLSEDEEYQWLCDKYKI